MSLLLLLINVYLLNMSIHLFLSKKLLLIGLSILISQGSLKDEMQKIQKTEKSIQEKLSELSEKKRGVQVSARMFCSFNCCSLQRFLLLQPFMFYLFYCY